MWNVGLVVLIMVLQALGMVTQLPDGDQTSMSKKQIIARYVVIEVAGPVRHSDGRKRRSSYPTLSPRLILILPSLLTLGVPSPLLQA